MDPSVNIIPPTQPLAIPTAPPTLPTCTVVQVVVREQELAVVPVVEHFHSKPMEMVRLRLPQVVSFPPMVEMYPAPHPMVVVVDRVDPSAYPVKPLPTTVPFKPKGRLLQVVASVAVAGWSSLSPIT